MLIKYTSGTKTGLTENRNKSIKQNELKVLGCNLNETNAKLLGEHKSNTQLWNGRYLGWEYIWNNLNMGQQCKKYKCSIRLKRKKYQLYAVLLRTHLKYCIYYSSGHHPLFRTGMTNPRPLGHMWPCTTRNAAPQYCKL